AAERIEAPLELQQPLEHEGVASPVGHFPLSLRGAVLSDEEPVHELDRLSVVKDPRIDHVMELVDGQRYEPGALSGRDLLDQPAVHEINSTTPASPFEEPPGAVLLLKDRRRM